MGRSLLIVAVLVLVLLAIWYLVPRGSSASGAAPGVSDAGSASAAPGSPAGAQPLPAPVPPAQPIRHAPDSSPAVASIAAARDGKHPERLSPLVTPAPFDAAAFARDPQPYLQTVEPGRVQQTAVPAEGATRLRVLGEPRPLLEPGGTLLVRMQGVPLAPVSFLAVGGGSFVENGLNAITVRADAEGLAFVTYRADPGTVGDAPIIAASPLAVGQQTVVPHVGDAAVVRRMPPPGAVTHAPAAASATAAAAASSPSPASSSTAASTGATP